MQVPALYYQSRSDPLTDSLKWYFQMLLLVPPQRNQPQQHSAEDEDAWVKWAELVVRHGGTAPGFCWGDIWVNVQYFLYSILDSGIDFVSPLQSCGGLSLAVFRGQRCRIWGQVWWCQVSSVWKAFQTTCMSFRKNGGSRGTVRGSRSWLESSGDHECLYFEPIYPVVVEIFHSRPKWWTDIAILRAASMATCWKIL